MQARSEFAILKRVRERAKHAFNDADTADKQMLVSAGPVVMFAVSSNSCWQGQNNHNMLAPPSIRCMQDVCNGF